MRLLIPYFLLLVLVFFVACGYARRSARHRRNVLMGGWAVVAVFIAGTIYFMRHGQADMASTAIVGFGATAMLAYAVRAVERRTRAALDPGAATRGRRRVGVG